METVLTLDEIRERFASEWVLIGDPTGSALFCPKS